MLYDRQHENFWLQLSGTAVAGGPFGEARTELERIPATLMGLSRLREVAPDADVLLRPRRTGHRYGRNPYRGYDRPANRPFLYDEGPVDDRLPQMTRVVGIDAVTPPIAIPESRLREEGTLALDLGGRHVTVWWAPGQSAALEGSSTLCGRDVGQVVVFDAEAAGGEVLTFDPAEEDAATFVDRQTGTTWDDLVGRAVRGPLEGERLETVPHDVTFWFAWFAFHTDTVVHDGPSAAAFQGCPGH